MNKKYKKGLDNTKLMIKKIKNFQLCFYDKLGCYDESFYDIDDGAGISYAIECLTKYENLYYPDEYQRLFVNFNDGTRYEIKLVEDE